MSKRELIIDAALKLFVEQGFHGTATGKIAQEAGVATGTLFQYFKTKDELVVALYINIKDELTESVKQNTIHITDTKETIKAQFLASLFWALDNPAKFRFIQQFQTSPYINQVEQQTLDMHLLPHLTLIQRGIEEGTLKPLTVDFLYMLISNQTFGLHQYMQAKKLSKAEQHAIIQTTFDMLWDMLT